MGPWQETCLANDVTNFVSLATVDTLAVFHNVAAQNAGLKLLESGTEVLVFELLFCEGCFDRVSWQRQQRMCALACQ